MIDHSTGNTTLENLIGDYVAFFGALNGRLRGLGIDISDRELSHVCVRTESYTHYLRVRDALETFCRSNIENVWNGRPMSIMQLKSPLQLDPLFSVGVIELIPPPHRRVYKMGLEHLGVVVGPAVDDFSRKHRNALTGQQFQSEECEPYYVTFYDDFTSVKFYREPLLRICESQHGRQFAGFSHVEGWHPDID